MNTGYRFHVSGHLDDRWSEWLGGFSIERRDDGTSVLSGPIADQAALHGVIVRIRDLGLPLLAVECVSGECAGVPWTTHETRGSPTRCETTHESLKRPNRTLHPTNDIEGDRPCD